MKNVIQNISFLIIIIFILNGCYQNETVDSKILIRPSEKYNFEIEIPIHYEGRGNIHTLDISKYEFEQSDWIYTNVIKGELEASEIIFTHYHLETENPWKQKKLKGSIEFWNDSLLINIKIPWYNRDSNTPIKWVNYKYNGKYLIEILKK